MNHATRALIAGLLILGLAAGGWFLFDRAAPLEPDRSTSTDEDTETAPDQTVEANPGLSSGTDAEATPGLAEITVRPGAPTSSGPMPELSAVSPAPRAFRDARAASSAGALQDVADRYRAAGETGLADDLETLAYELCGGIEGFSAPYPVTEWALVELLAWCEDYPAALSPDDFRNRTLAGANIVTYLDRYPAIAALSPSERAFEIARMAVDADTPGELHAVRQMVTNLATAGPSRSVFLDTTGLSDLVDFNASHRAALVLLECRKFGGCGPGDPLTLQHCVLSGVCERGWSREEAQRNLLTPVEWEIALSILGLFDSVSASDG
jgi:hypothetical protein